uniref:Uncharacterized protein n=1 Tax=viral metagenome TaxID=1070528 RepID=A0A6C0E4A7_9ZZZZ
MKHYKKISIRKKRVKRVSNKNKSKKHRLWKMKGCARNATTMVGGCGCGTPANNMMMSGGVSAGGILAYTPDTNYTRVNNLAYTGKGGSKKEGFLPGVISGGVGTCKVDNMPSGASYPSGPMGNSWRSNPHTWPGVAGVQGSTNYLPYNEYSYPQVDRMLENTEAIPFSFGGKSNKSKKRTFRKHMRKYKSTKSKKYQKGGLPLLTILNDVENTWNSLRGNPQIASPLPFNNQLENSNQQNMLNM